MKSQIAFHFLLLASGEVLKIYDYVTPEKLQAFISEKEEFAFRPPLSECELALELMENVGYLTKKGREYIRGNRQRSIS